MIPFTPFPDLLMAFKILNKGFRDGPSIDDQPLIHIDSDSNVFDVFDLERNGRGLESADEGANLSVAAEEEVRVHKRLSQRGSGSADGEEELETVAHREGVPATSHSEERFLRSEPEKYL
ncbi:hypothetical protein HK097_010515 [Rhizophlyctis rosea]|uniref:Uncharacterized protein n=1 Tax=Rhizophlyctis rosea TaxID=64517 RepID=A0AAD5SAR0_9FUNG|nr:hypothetical protein HK097_010515 [Rhizophlyctis rosea]